MNGEVLGIELVDGSDKVFVVCIRHDQLKPDASVAGLLQTNCCHCDAILYPTVAVRDVLTLHGGTPICMACATDKSVVEQLRKAP